MDQSSNSSLKEQTTPTQSITLGVTLGGLAVFFCLASCIAMIATKRSHRHPELYAPRPATATRPAQSRAKGLARAVLDTFPTFTWSSERQKQSTNEDATAMTAVSSAHKAKQEDDKCNVDVEGQKDENYEGVDSELEEELKDETVADQEVTQDGATSPKMTTNDGDSSRRGSSIWARPDFQVNAERVAQPMETASYSVDEPVESTSQDKSKMPSHDEKQQVGHAEDEGLQITCPICTDDFVDGDEVRVLPCSGRHHYHSACIDEWMAGHSVCPLCRFDFAPPADVALDQQTDATIEEVTQTDIAPGEPEAGHDEMHAAIVIRPSSQSEEMPPGAGAASIDAVLTPRASTSEASQSRRHSSHFPSPLRTASSPRFGRPLTSGAHFTAFRNYCITKKAQRFGRYTSKRSNPVDTNTTSQSRDTVLSPQSRSVDTALAQRAALIEASSSRNRNRASLGLLSASDGSSRGTQACRANRFTSGITGGSHDIPAQRPACIATRTNVARLENDAGAVAMAAENHDLDDSNAYHLPELRLQMSDAHGFGMW
ncbi:unnamed protein product [Sympodiomycopsis kandeliae]